MNTYDDLCLLIEYIICISTLISIILHYLMLFKLKVLKTYVFIKVQMYIKLNIKFIFD